MSLPAIPQQSSIDHADSIDVSSKHEKKKSISALALQDLQLDRRANMGNFKRTKDSIVNAPLTPLAMMTQIGSVAYTQSMTSPPLLNGGTMRGRAMRTYIPHILRLPLWTAMTTIVCLIMQGRV